MNRERQILALSAAGARDPQPEALEEVITLAALEARSASSSLSHG